MQSKRNLFDYFVYTIVGLILSSNIIFIFLIKNNTINIENISLIVILIFLLLEALFISLIIDNFYSKPIRYLNENINNFITWKNKWKEIKIKTKQKNPNIAYILKFFDVVLNSLKNIKEEFLSWKAIKWEIELARELQEKLLNKKLETIPSLDIIAKSKPAWEVWWDSYDIIKQKNNYYIYVWDATWHWVGAWFVMVMVNALISWFSKIFKSGAWILTFTNEILKPRVKSNILMTLLLIRWDEEQKRLFMTWAWHEYLIIYKHNLWKCFLIKSWWLALWMTKDISKVVKEQEIKFEENDIIVMYTDWITEAINQSKKDWNEQMFWEERLKKAIENSPNLSWTNIKTARWVFNNITIELSKFMWYKHIQHDDMTLVVIHYKWNKNIENDFPSEISEEFITEWNWNKK